LILLTLIVIIRKISEEKNQMVNDNESKILNVKLTQEKIKSIVNVTYSQPVSYFRKNIKLEMDILKPNREGKYPTVLFVPGGSFAHSYKENYLQQRLEIAKAGYVVASMEYRTIPDGVFPQSLEDVKAAIRFLKANADEYGIDKGKIALMGESAGGYLVAMAGVTSGIADYDKGDNLSENSDVQAVVDIYGVTDFGEVDFEIEDIDECYKATFMSVKFWLNDVRNNVESTNPISYISQKTPPFLLMHGDADTLVLPNQTEMLHKALIEKGVDSKRYIVPGAGHSDEYWFQPEVTELIIDFLNKKIKNI